MRTIVTLFISLYSIAAAADQVFFKPLANHNVNGDITINSSPTKTEIHYHFKNVPERKSYAIVVYQQGSCTGYSSAILPMVTENDGSTAPYEWHNKNALLDLSWGAANEAVLNTPLPPGTYSTKNERQGLMNGLSINNVDFKNKILVVEETDANNKPNGVGVACGVHP